MSVHAPTKKGQFETRFAFLDGIIANAVVEQACGIIHMVQRAVLFVISDEQSHIVEIKVPSSVLLLEGWLHLWSQMGRA